VYEFIDLTFFSTFFIVITNKEINMCDFFSGIIGEADESILVYDCLSHSATADHFGLKGEEYREFEWTEQGLTVRVPDGHKKSKSWYIAIIMAKFETRKDMIDFYFKDEEIQELAVKQNGWAIKYIAKPSINIQKFAVKQDGDAIKYIVKPSIKIQELAVQQSGWAIKYIENPSIKIQELAVKRDGYAIIYINQPSLEIKELARKQREGC
jgi:hypothetical protein